MDEEPFQGIPTDTCWNDDPCLVVVILRRDGSTQLSTGDDDLMPLVSNVCERLDSVEGFTHSVLLSVIVERKTATSLARMESELVKEYSDALSAIRPPQMYRFRGATEIDIDDEKLAIVVHRLNGCTRYHSRLP